MKRLVIPLLVMLAVAHPARAEPPVCQGTDLLKQLEASDPAAHARVMEEARKSINVEAMLWKIEKAGVEPSYLMGTAHVTDPRVTRLSNEARAALGEASLMALELKEIQDPNAMAIASAKLARYMVLPPGENLWDLIPDDLEPLVRDNPNLDERARNTIFGLQPWVVALSLAIPPCEKHRQQSGIKSLDETLAAEARTLDIPLVGLETLEEQFSALSSLPLDQQVDYLIATARSTARVTDYMETLITLYEQRMVTALSPLSREIEQVDKGQEEAMIALEQNLLLNRNRLMAERAAPLIDKGDAFIAVGALHLPGEEGLVELLRKAGYTVTPVN